MQHKIISVRQDIKKLTAYDMYSLYALMQKHVQQGEPIRPSLLMSRANGRYGSNVFTFREVSIARLAALYPEISQDSLIHIFFFIDGVMFQRSEVRATYCFVNDTIRYAKNKIPKKWEHVRKLHALYEHISSSQGLVLDPEQLEYLDIDLESSSDDDIPFPVLYMNSNGLAFIFFIVARELGMQVSLVPTPSPDNAFLRVKDEAGAAWNYFPEDLDHPFTDEEYLARTGIAQQELSRTVFMRSLTDTEVISLLCYQAGFINQSHEYYEQALRWYTRALNGCTINPWYYSQAGYCELKLNRFELAEEHFARAISLLPDNAFLYYQQGIAMFLLKKYQHALEFLGKAIMLDPNDARQYYFLGNTYFMLLTYEQARQFYELAVQLDRKNEIYKKNLEIVKKVISGNGKAARPEDNEIILLI